jgi:hypothetical protein
MSIKNLIAVIILFQLCIIGQTITIGDNVGDNLIMNKSFQFGHYPTGELDTVKAEIIIESPQTYSLDNTRRTLQIVEGFIEREKYSYCGDRMPNQYPNSGGIYDAYFVTKRYLDENKNEIQEHVWMSREIE